MHESWHQTSLGCKRPLKVSSSILLPWARTSSNLSKPHPTWPWMFRELGHLPPFWAACSTLIVKNLFVSNQNWPSFTLNPLSLVLLQHTRAKTFVPIFLTRTFKHWKVPQSLLQAELSQLSQPVFIREEIILYGPSLDHLQQVLW